MFTHRGTFWAYLMPLVFGASMMLFGCTTSQMADKAEKASVAFDTKVAPATTQALTTVGQLAGTVAVAAPLGSATQTIAGTIAAATGLLLVIERLTSGGLKGLALTLRTAANQDAATAAINTAAVATALATPPPVAVPTIAKVDTPAPVISHP